MNNSVKTSIMLPSNVFRASAGAVIINTEGMVLALERVLFKNAWQMPQGGVEENETPYEAVLREVEEETGLSADDLELLDEYPEWLAYELPETMRTGKHGRGQVQKWFLFRLKSPESAIQLEQGKMTEFSRWKWMTLKELAAVTIPFRRSIYTHLAEGFAKYIA